MKHLSFIILLCLVGTILKAQTFNGSIKPPRPKVGVVLGGGGAKGASHIGVLKYLEELDIPIDYVAGTSMGSILGGLYALGYEPDEMTRLISDMQWNEYIGNKIDRIYLSKEVRDRLKTSLLNIPFGEGTLERRQNKSNLISQLPSAYVNNSSLINLFNDLCIGYQTEMDFNDMPIPFACVATDLITGQEVVLREGSVPTAMRASMAIPGVFAPVPWGDYVLVDGGLVNNFPADVLREMGADIIIGVEVTNENKITAEDLKSLPQVMGRILINGTSAKRKENRELCDIRIVPDIYGFRHVEFHARGHRHLGETWLQESSRISRRIVGHQTICRERGWPSRQQRTACSALPHCRLLRQRLAARPLPRRGSHPIGRHHQETGGRIKTQTILRYRGTGRACPPFYC